MVILQYNKISYVRFDSGQCCGCYHFSSKETATVVSLEDALTWIGSRKVPSSWAVVRPSTSK